VGSAMSECFVCGRSLARGEGVRRTVQTGERRSRSRRPFHLFSSRLHTSKQYAPRTICLACATEIDAEEEASRKRQMVLAVGLLGLCIVLVLWCIISSAFNK
jgi:hypothetical protein